MNAEIISLQGSVQNEEVDDVSYFSNDAIEKQNKPKDKELVKGLFCIDEKSEQSILSSKKVDLNHE